jgi:hypothetical protein
LTFVTSGIKGLHQKMIRFMRGSEAARKIVDIRFHLQMETDEDRAYGHPIRMSFSPLVQSSTSAGSGNTVVTPVSVSTKSVLLGKRKASDGASQPSTPSKKQVQSKISSMAATISVDNPKVDLTSSIKPSTSVSKIRSRSPAQISDVSETQDDELPDIDQLVSSFQLPQSSATESLPGETIFVRKIDNTDDVESISDASKTAQAIPHLTRRAAKSRKKSSKPQNNH